MEPDGQQLPERPVTVWWFLVPLCTLGFGTFAMVLTAAAYLRSRRTAVVASLYLALSICCLTAFGVESPGPVLESLVFAALFGQWLGGTGHVAYLQIRMAQSDRFAPPPVRHPVPPSMPPLAPPSMPFRPLSASPPAPPPRFVPAPGVPAPGVVPTPPVRRRPTPPSGDKLARFMPPPGLSSAPPVPPGPAAPGSGAPGSVAPRPGVPPTVPGVPQPPVPGAGAPRPPAPGAPRPAGERGPGDDPAVIAARQRLNRRRQSRAMVENEPTLARELRIGRPDLPRQYDDGGLIDINHVSAETLVTELTISPELARVIVAERDRLGGYGSPDELIVYCSGVTPELVASIRDRLLFLPL